MNDQEIDKTAIAVRIFDKWATTYQERFMDVSLYDDSLTIFCSNLSESETRIVEIACGPGNLTRALLQKRPDFEILSTDLAPAMLDLARKNNPTVDVQLLDARQMRSLHQQFHGIICGFAFPYLSKEEVIQFIRDACHMLLPDGLIYISTMEDDHSKSSWQKGSTGEEIFMNYHEAFYLKEALDSNGFTVILEDRITYQSGDHQVTDLILIGKRKA